MSNGVVDPVLRSASASLGNRFEIGTEKLHSAYISLVKDRVLTYKQKYTGMILVHYACEYGCSRILRSLCKVRGPRILVQMLC